MRDKYFLLLLILSVSFNLFGQTKTGFEFLPSGLNFMPLKANTREARIGVLFYPDNRNLKVDIGNSIDLAAINFADSEKRLTVGIEFMAYALSTSFKGKRLQIDAVDGFFGGNLSYTRKIGVNKFIARLRIIHNSAHFVDGHFDVETNAWLNNDTPVPYTEDFGELTVGQQHFIENFSIKYFGGFSYSTLIRPYTLKRYNFHTGFELVLYNILGKIKGSGIELFLANYLNTYGTDSYSVSQQTMLGVKLGDWEKKGIVLYLSYYSGRNIYGSYYDREVSKFGLGFSVDFP